MAKSVTRRNVIITGASAAAIAPFAASLGTEVGAEEAMAHEIQMLNRHPEDRRQSMVYFPRVLSVKPGDTVTFLSVDKGHNTKTIKDMIPDGPESWDSKLNEDFEITFDAPGFYGYQCTPHASTGMVGLIVVEGEGKLANLEAAQGVRHRGRSRKVWEEIWSEAEEMGLLEETVA